MTPIKQEVQEMPTLSSTGVGCTKIEGPRRKMQKKKKKYFRYYLRRYGSQLYHNSGLSKHAISSHKLLTTYSQTSYKLLTLEILH